MIANLFLWSWQILSHLSPLLIVIFVSIVLILVYLYKTSEVMSKKILAWLLIAVLIIFILINFFVIYKNQPPKKLFRLTLFPLQHESSLSHQAWLGDVFWTMLGQQLHKAVGDQAVVLSADWTTAIVNADSLNDIDYLNRLNSQIKGEYFLVSKVSANGSEKTIVYQMINTSDKAVVLEGNLTLLPEKFPELSLKVCNQILSYYEFPVQTIDKDVRFVSAEGYRKLLHARNFYQKKNYDQVLNLTQQSIEADSNLVEACLLTGKAYFMKALEQKKNGESPVENFHQAYNWLSKTVELDSSNGEAFAFLGEYYVYRERWSVAEQKLFKAFKLNPNFPRVYLSLSRLHDFRYKKLGFVDEKQLFEQAIFINPCYEDAYLMLSDYYLFENKRDQAIVVLEQILGINPNSVPALMALGKIYLVRNDILKIIEVFNRVIELEANNSNAYYNLGILYYNSEDFENSERFLKRAIAIDNHLNSHLYLAYLYEVKGYKEQAIKYLRNRIRYRKGRDDEFAEEARKHLYNLMHTDSTIVNRNAILKTTGKQQK